jgi:hypothetical protein
MPTLRNSIDIEAPADQVFDYVSDLANELEWGPSVIRVERLGNGSLGVGTRFLAEWKGSDPVEVEYVLFERPQRWRAVGRNPRMDTNLSGEVVPLTVGTSRLTATMELLPHGVFRLLTPILGRKLQRMEQENLAALKRAIERKLAEAATL